MWDKPTWKQLFLRIPKKQERHYDFQLLSSHASNMALENNYKTNRLCYILTEEVIFQYKYDNFYAPQCEGALAWDDPALKIDWKVPADKIILSGKDQHHECLEEASWLFDYNENLY